MKGLYVELKSWLEDFLKLEIPFELPNNIYATPLKIYYRDNNTDYFYQSSFIVEGIQKPIFSIDSIELLFGNEQEYIDFEVIIDSSNNLSFSKDFILRFKNSELFKVARFNSQTLKYEITPDNLNYDVDLGNIALLLSNINSISLKSDIEINFPICFLANTGIIFEIKKVSIDNVNFNEFIISTEEARIILPEVFIIPNQTEILIKNAKISSTGFSGGCSVELPLSYHTTEKKFKYNDEETTIFGIPGGLKYVEIVLENNQPTTFKLEGQLLIPYFDTPVDVSFKIEENGDITTTIKSISTGDIVLTKDELISLSIQSIEIKKEGTTGSFKISGSLQPLLHSSEGMKWPKLDVKNLKLDSTGKFSIDEAWLDLKEMATLNLFGFHLELRKIGFGTLLESGIDKIWLDLSGGLKLIEQIPIGLDIEGFRIIWPQNLSIASPITASSIETIASQIDIKFKGVQFSLGVSGAVQLDGMIRFFKDAQAVGFAGDMVLVIPPASITAEGGLLVGMNTEQPNPFPFFYVYFGLESAAGIPLGQSGLALKGAIGLFGINVAPNRIPPENWYFDWYKKAPAPGAHQTTKWTYERNALAIGAGVTITTVDGVIKGTKGIFVLALPGPIIVINGRALILDGLNPNPSAEPPFSATAIFDGQEKIVQFNIEAQAEIVEDVIDAYAGIEAFFDFKDLTNWHLYLGQNEPKSRRIRANVLKIIEADAYLMFDMIDANSLRARMGINVNAKADIDDICIDIPLWGEECITFDAHLDYGGDGEMSMQPEQFSGNVHLDAGVTIAALGKKLSIGAIADIATEGPSPFSLEADLNLYASMPDPLPNYDDTYHFELHIPKVELNVNDPLTSVSLFSRFTSESKGLKIESSTKRDDNAYLLATTLAECDINPILAFEHEMNQTYPFIMHPNATKTFEVGAISFNPLLENVIIREKNKNGNTGWTIIYSTKTIDNKPILGTWLAESDTSSPVIPASKRLLLMSTNPLTNTAHSTGTMGYLMMQPEANSTHLSQQVLEDYPDLMLCSAQAPTSYCVNFIHAGKPIKNTRINWSSLVFDSSSEIIIDSTCLMFLTNLNISFPKSVAKVEIEFCEDIKQIDLKNIKAFSKPKGRQLADLLTKSKKEKKIIDTGCSIPKSANISTIYNNKITINVTIDSFDCLQIATKSGKIKSICYWVEQDFIDFEINKKICEDNKTNIYPPYRRTPSGDPYRDNNIFKPGCYYEIEVKSRLTGNVMNIGGRTEDIIIETLYQENLDNFNAITQTSKFAYFQTVSPPQNLEPYIKWTLPCHQDNYIYATNPIIIRFKRGYINTLFGNNAFEPHKLQVWIKDIDGKLNRVSNTNLHWASSDASTLYPDEETWQNHLSANDISNAFRKDDILTITMNGQAFYKPNSRYELYLIGIKRTEITTEELAKNKNVVKLPDGYYNVLSSKTFTTSKFDSFTSLIKSGNIVENQVLTDKIKPIIYAGNSVSFDSSFDEKITNYVNQELIYNKTLVDYEYGMAKAIKDGVNLVSKEAVEHQKLVLRTLRDIIDQEFKRVALLINSEILFKEIEGKLTVFAIKNPSKKIEYIWLKLPEVLRIKMNSSSFLNIDFSLILSPSQLISRISNTDTSQIIFKLNAPILEAQLKNVSISSTYIKDLDDDKTNSLISLDNKHHRYDRPTFNVVSNETVTIGFT